MTNFMRREPAEALSIFLSIMMGCAGCSAGDLGSTQRIDAPGQVSDAAPIFEGEDAALNPDAAAAPAAPPYASAGIDQIVEAGQRVLLDGFESASSMGALQYHWSQIDGVAVELLNADHEMATFRAPFEPGHLIFELEVIDERGEVAQDHISVEVITLRPDWVQLERSPFRSPGVPSPVGANPFEIDFADGHAYVASGHYGLMVVDFRDLQAPSLVGSFHTPYDPRNVSSSGDVAVSDGVAYVSAGPQGLHIIDVSDPTDPTLIRTFSEVGMGLGVAIDGRTLYVTAGRGGVFALDVSIPAEPRILGRVATAGGARQPTLADGHLYSISGTSGVDIIDVSDPRHMRIVGRYPRPIERSAIYSVQVMGGVAFVGTNRDVRIVDVEDPTRVSEITTLPMDTLVMDIDADGSLIAVTVHNYGLLLFDVSDVTRPRLVGSYDSPDIAQGVRIHDGVAYVADGPAMGAIAIDITEPSLPSPYGRLQGIGNANGVDVQDGQAVIVTADTELVVAEVTSPSRPRLIARQSLTDHAYTVRLSGAHAYVATDAGVEVVRILESGVPVYLGAYEATDGIFDLRITGDTAIAVGGGPLQFVDISNPAHPTLRGTLNTGYAGFGVLIDHDRAFVSTYYGLMVADIHDIETPEIESAERTTSLFGWGLGRHGDRLYVADEADGLYVLDISDPTAPRRLEHQARPGLRDLVIEGDTLFLSTTNEGLERYAIDEEGTLHLEASFGTFGAPQRIHVEEDLVFLAAGRAGLLTYDTASRVEFIERPIVGYSDEAVRYRVRWEVDHPDARPEVVCRVAAGDCVVLDIDHETHIAEVQWTLPADPGDHELLVVVGDYQGFTVARGATRVNSPER